MSASQVYTAFIDAPVPESLNDIFIAEEASYEPPAKRRKLEEAEANVAKLLSTCFTVAKFHVDLKYAHPVSSNVQYYYAVPYKNDGVPITQLSCKGTGYDGPVSLTFRARLKNTNYNTTIDNIWGFEDFPISTTARIPSIYQASSDDLPPVLFASTLHKSTHDSRHFSLELSFLVPDSIYIPGHLGTNAQQILDAYFPGLDEPTQEESFSTREFYSSVHVPPKTDTPSVYSPLIGCELFPFQRRAVRWLLSREGVDLADDGHITPLPSTEEAPLPLSFLKTQDVEGRPCFSSPFLRVVTSDISDCWNPLAELKGGILAEEMGLGKTVEMIALICLNRRELHHEDSSKPLVNSEGHPILKSGATLIVTPYAILDQWEQEIKRHAPNLKILTYYGVKEEMGATKREFVEELASYDVVLTTYGTLSGEIYYATKGSDRVLRRERTRPPKRSPLVQISWWRVCLDEAQMVENGVSNAAQVVRVVPRCNAWAVTGTPLKKNMDDLFGLLLFLHFEPFCYTYSLWRRLYTRFKPLFRELVGKITLRHSKASIRDELLIPPQKRFVIKVPFTAVEEEHYTELYDQMCEDVGLDRDGGPLSDYWDPNDRTTIEKMRHWLLRLRQTCLHPEIGGLGRRVAGGGRQIAIGPLRSVAEVLEMMIEENEAQVVIEERKYLMAVIRRGQVYENAKRPKEALELWRRALEHSEVAVSDARTALTKETERQRAKQGEKAKGKAQKEQTAQHDEGTHDDDNDDEETKKDRARISALSARVRLSLEVKHICQFFIGNALYQIKANTEYTEPDSEEYKNLDIEESKAYEDAKQTRKEMLKEPSARASKWAGTLKARIQEKGFVDLPQMDVEVSETGIESQTIADRLNYFTESMNAHAEQYKKWREHVVKLLTTQLLDQDDDTELEGNEYESSAKHQDELYAYVEALRALNAYRYEAVSGQPNHLIRQEVANNISNAKDGQGPAPELYIKLMDVCQRHKQSDSVRAIIDSCKTAIQSLEWEHNNSPEDNPRAPMEIQLIKGLLAQAIKLTAPQSKACHALDQEVRLIMNVMNARLEYYRQLQSISDQVTPYDEENEGKEPNKLIYENMLNTEKEMLAKIAAMKSKHRYLIHLRDDPDAEESSKICVICQTTIDIGVLTVCGHKYCKECFYIWYNQHSTCPLCKKRLLVNELHKISHKPVELIAEEESLQKSVISDKAKNETATNMIYTDVSSGVLREVMDIQLDYSYGTKIDTLAKHLIWLRHRDPGCKAVVFSQYRSFINLLATAFRRFQIGYRSFNMGDVDSFRKDPSVECFLLHSKAQSSGLNLVNATHVFLCEPLVNTAIELQAIARVHRIGQRHETTVWMYLVAGSVEESIYDVSVRRRMEHIERKGASRRKDALRLSAQEGLSEDVLETANSLELQETPIGVLTEKQSDGERVAEDDLWQCLFGKRNTLGSSLPQQSASNENDRERRAAAAEERGNGMLIS